MASAKSLIAAGVLAMPCVDAFVVPGSTQGVSALRGTAPVSAQSESKFGAYSYSAFAAVSAAAVLSAGHKKHVGRKHMACNFSRSPRLVLWIRSDSLILPQTPTSLILPACAQMRQPSRISALFPRQGDQAWQVGRLYLDVFGVFFCWVHRLYNYFILICTHEQFSWWYPERRLAMPLAC